MTDIPMEGAAEESGKRDDISLTPEAWAMAKELSLSNPDYQGLPLRLYIEGKGCDGFYYGVNFDKAEADDLHFDVDGLECIVDPRTHLFCKGSTIDWVDDERGKGFLVENPKEKNFRGKFYKKSTWRTRLEAMAAQGSNA
ncbi:MAG: iron-sulfur cluster assembly accessory protein [Proteobacteria bacterium]|nr:MAG: iron-sulfur cluster assembly accessory protein [Pseudomonadota bacterium]